MSDATISALIGGLAGAAFGALISAFASIYLTRWQLSAADKLATRRRALEKAMKPAGAILWKRVLNSPLNETTLADFSTRWSRAVKALELAIRPEQAEEIARPVWTYLGDLQAYAEQSIDRAEVERRRQVAYVDVKSAQDHLIHL